MSSYETLSAGQLVVLRGGPQDLPRVYRLPGHAASDPGKIAVAYYGRHEHFERSTETESVEDQSVPVFVWSYSTAIAE